ncbi:MAG: hypothetical protein PHO83_15705 [Geobacteraceae bacterium]|nr:hypothetical protein [Geobacteraceae bacterium]
MKRILFCLALVAVLPLPNAFASNVDFNIGINIGNRPPAVPLPPPPVYQPAPVYQEPVVEIDEPPMFIEPPELGFHVAVGIPQDLFFINNSYYLCQGNVWYISPYYRGPWQTVRYKSIPWVLRKHSYSRVRYYRDAGYRNYREARNPYWQRHHFRPQRQWKEVRYKENRSHAPRGDWKHDPTPKGHKQGRPY